jgi:hypothetical protein
VEERGPFGRGVPVDFDWDGGVAVFYAWQHFAPEFSEGGGISGCACMYVYNGCDFEETSFCLSHIDVSRSFMGARNCDVPRASVSPEEFGVELHANLRYLLRQHHRAWPTSYP